MMEINAHKLVAHVAEEMAQEVFEELSKDNRWHAINKDRAAFVRTCAPTLRQEARGILAGMLERHDVSEHDKREIFEALMLDKQIPQSGLWKAPVQGHA
jgi:hypothetical protein